MEFSGLGGGGAHRWFNLPGSMTAGHGSVSLLEKDFTFLDFMDAYFRALSILQSALWLALIYT